MSATYEPGTVAIATVRGVPNVRIAFADSDDDHYQWFVIAGDAADWVPNDAITGIRPLVVLDPEDLTTAGERGSQDPSGEVVSCLRNIADSESGTYRARVVYRIADQIEAQTKPPRIPEPGLWGVVKASGPLGENESSNEDEWVRTDDIVWRSRVTGWGVCWDQLNDPTLIRDGIEAGS